MSERVWAKPPKILSVAKEEIHLWYARLDLPPERFYVLQNYLSFDEKAHAARYREERDYVRFVVGRGGLREILGRYLQQEPAAIPITAAQWGKPVLERLGSPFRAALHFNLSHSGDGILYGVASHQQIGVDMERRHPEKDTKRFNQRFLSPKELHHFQQLVPARERAAFCYWTFKEAYCKAMGSGLSKGTHHGNEFLNWHYLPLRLTEKKDGTGTSEEYSAVAACEKAVRYVKFWRF